MHNQTNSNPKSRHSARNKKQLFIIIIPLRVSILLHIYRLTGLCLEEHSGVYNYIHSTNRNRTVYQPELRDPSTVRPAGRERARRADGERVNLKDRTLMKNIVRTSPTG